MAGFVFRLQPVLESRRRAEQDARRAVAHVQRQRLDIEDGLRRHQRQITSGKDRMRGSMIGALDMRALRLGAGATLHTIRKAQQLVLQLAGLNQRMGSARTKLVHAMTRRRAIEILREKRYDQWTFAQHKAEIAALDDLTVAAAARKERDP